MQPTCYFCDLPKVSDEHAPARIFFDTHKYKNLNLITVPSCEKHNNTKSQFDCILGILFHSGMDISHLDDKKRESILKYKKYMMDRYIHPNSVELLPSEQRDFKDYLEMLSAALFYYKTKFSLKLKSKYPKFIDWRFLQIGNDHISGEILLKDEIYFEKFIQGHIKSALRKVSYPYEYKNEQFQANIYECEPLCMIEMCFYKNIKIYTIFGDDNSKLNTLDQYTTL